MIRGLLLVLLVVFSITSAEAGEPARLKYPAECVLKLVAGKMNVRLKPEVPVPTVYFESQITLEEFQDAVEPWWKFRPSAVLNVYIPLSERIYLIDDAAYYEKHGRAIDDSLAHEFTHFIQARYQNADLSTGEDWLELIAIEVQTWFRDEYIKKPQDISVVCGPMK